MSGFRLLLAAAAMVGVASAANANSITFSGAVGVASTNYATSVGFSKFDPALGTLTAVNFNLSGTVNGSAKAESLDAAPTNVTLNLAATITLEKPAGAGVLAVVLPTASTLDAFTAFDGAIDFGGTSGATHAELTNTQTGTGTAASSDFALFTGTEGDPGTIDLVFSAQGTSNGSGSGNLITQFSTQALANADVTYVYTVADVPEPASMAILGAGLVGAGLLRRKRA